MSLDDLFDDHDVDDDHDHDEDIDLSQMEGGEDIEGIEVFHLKSVGIDIGSSTSHLVFSRLTLRREGANYSSQFKVTAREVLYRSPIMLTPYSSGVLMDTAKIEDFIHRSYKDAGVTPEDVDTGAVVITGEALKKENARPILEMFAKEAGKFICASAGPAHEALLAAYGCGAVSLSKETASTVLNIDMGGGTTKFSLIEKGVVAQVASVEIGARLIAYDEQGTITRIENPARVLMADLGHKIEIGDPLPRELQEPFAALMAKVLAEVIQGQPLSDLTQSLMLTEPLRAMPGLRGVDYIVFSGGVSEYVYDHEKQAYGDLGPIFGKAMRDQIAGLGKSGIVREPTEGIRATVIGAGEYTVQASGSTSYISSHNPLPIFGLKVVRLVMNGLPVEDAIQQALGKFDLTSFGEGMALAVSIVGQQDYWSLRKLAESLARVVEVPEAGTAPLYLVLDQDVAKSLGGIMKEELHVGRDIIAIDGIDVGDLDYIDIGKPMGVTEVLPVTVKSLMFPQRSYAALPKD